MAWCLPQQHEIWAMALWSGISLTTGMSRVPQSPPAGMTGLPQCELSCRAALETRPNTPN